MDNICLQSNFHETYQCQKCFEARLKMLNDDLLLYYDGMKHVIFDKNIRTKLHPFDKIQFDVAKEHFTRVRIEIVCNRSSSELSYGELVHNALTFGSNVALMSTPNICNGDITLTQQIVSSSAGAFLTSVMVTPMDVVKIRLQSQVHPIAEGECFLYSNGLMDHLCMNCANPATKAPCQWYNRPGQFTGTIDAFVKIARNEGVRSLWSGLSPTIISAIPATVFYFTIYDNLLHLMRRKYGDRIYVPLFVGAIARATAVTVVSPIEMIRTKMQSEALSYKQIGSALATTVRNDGYIALWRGLGPTILRDIPFSAIYWTGFEALKKFFVRYLNRDRTDFGISFTCGAIAGTVAAVITLPFDVIKTHRQITLGDVRSHETTSFRKQYRERGTLPLMRELVRSQGYRALFAGLTPRIAKIAPACATMIASYDYLKNVFSKRNKETCKLNNLTG